MSAGHAGHRRPHRHLRSRAYLCAAADPFAVYYLLPLYVMLVNSLKPLAEIQQGRMLSLPSELTFEPWRSAHGRPPRSACSRPASSPISSIRC